MNKRKSRWKKIKQGQARDGQHFWYISDYFKNKAIFNNALVSRNVFGCLNENEWHVEMCPNKSPGSKRCRIPEAKKCQATIDPQWTSEVPIKMSVFLLVYCFPLLIHNTKNLLIGHCVRMWWKLSVPLPHNHFSFLMHSSLRTLSPLFPFSTHRHQSGRKLDSP